MLDYIIVGSGLAGISFAETLLQEQKTFVVIDAPITNSSKVAGGLYNPVVLKRFTMVWESAAQMQLLDQFYATIEQRIACSIDHKVAVLRKFNSIEEQNNWFIASDKPGLAHYLSSKLYSERYLGIDSPFDYGEVLHTGYVDVALLLKQYQNYLLQQQYLLNEQFIHADLQIHDSFVSYRAIKARRLVFAEGFAMNANPYFNQLPLEGVKGELLLIKAPLLQLDKILNASIFILPLGNDLYKVGATYNWADKSDLPTAEGKQELVDKLAEVICCEFKVLDHLAGVRPSVKDRKALVGTHAAYANVHLLNGLGTRGVMLGPYLAKLLFNHIEYAEALPKEIDLRRYAKKI